MNRSNFTSQRSSVFKLEPIDIKTHHTSNYTTKSSNKLNTTKSPVAATDLTHHISKDDVLDLQRKILGFVAKDDKATSSRYLFQLKGNYDHMAKEMKRKETETQQLKSEIEVLKRNIVLSRGSRDSDRKDMEELEKNCQTVKEKQQMVCLTSKTLEQIVSRMRKDEFVHQQRISDLDEKIKELDSTLKETELKTLNIDEHQSSNMVTAGRVKQEYLECMKQRGINLNIYQHLVLQKHSQQEKQEDRNATISEIQAMAASDLNDSDFVRWKKLLTVHSFVRKVFKVKVNNLEEKYTDLKRCYNTIRAKTTITNPQNLSSSYFQMENIFRQGVEHIRGLEERENQLMTQNQELQKKWKEVQADSSKLSREVESGEESLNLVKRKEIEDKWFRVDLLSTRMLDWVLNSRWRLESESQKGDSKEEFLRSQSKKTLGQQLSCYCEGLVGRCKQLQSSEESLANLDELQMLESCVSGKGGSLLESQTGLEV